MGTGMLIRAVSALDQFDSRKHSGVIVHFRQFYIKTGEFPVIMSDIIASTSKLREQADYDDFYIVSKKDTLKQLENAKIFLKEVKAYLQKKIEPQT